MFPDSPLLPFCKNFQNFRVKRRGQGTRKTFSKKIIPFDGVFIFIEGRRGGTRKNFLGGSFTYRSRRTIALSLFFVKQNGRRTTLEQFYHLGISNWKARGEGRGRGKASVVYGLRNETRYGTTFNKTVVRIPTNGGHRRKGRERETNQMSVQSGMIKATSPRYLRLLSALSLRDFDITFPP